MRNNKIIYSKHFNQTSLHSSIYSTKVYISYMYMCCTSKYKPQDSPCKNTHTANSIRPIRDGVGMRRRRRRRRQSRRQVRSSFSSRISYKMFLYIPREIWYHTYFINQPIHKEDDDDVKITKKGFQGVCVCMCAVCIHGMMVRQDGGKFLAVSWGGGLSVCIRKAVGKIFILTLSFTRA